ncbi:hypothetical protein P9112_004581 [Eukaryota sp. TZLM1-RC]
MSSPTLLTQELADLLINKTERIRARNGCPWLSQYIHHPQSKLTHQTSYKYIEPFELNSLSDTIEQYREAAQLKVTFFNYPTAPFFLSPLLPDFLNPVFNTFLPEIFPYSESSVTDRTCIIDTPTPIQAQIWPYLLADPATYPFVYFSAGYRAGKVLAYTIPALLFAKHSPPTDHWPVLLIVSPSRPSCLGVKAAIEKYVHAVGLGIAVVTGTVHFENQIAPITNRLEHTEVVIGTYDALQRLLQIKNDVFTFVRHVVIDKFDLFCQLDSRVPQDFDSVEAIDKNQIPITYYLNVFLQEINYREQEHIEERQKWGHVSTGSGYQLVLSSAETEFAAVQNHMEKFLDLKNRPLVTIHVGLQEQIVSSNFQIKACLPEANESTEDCKLRQLKEDLQRDDVKQLESIVVVCPNNKTVDKVYSFINRNLYGDYARRFSKVSGSSSKKQKQANLASFRSKKLKLLICTDQFLVNNPLEFELGFIFQLLANQKNLERVVDMGACFVTLFNSSQDGVFRNAFLHYLAEKDIQVPSWLNEESVTLKKQEVV